MSAADLTAAFGVLVALATGVVLPVILRRRAAIKATADTEVVSWTSLNKAITLERDRSTMERDKLRKELDQVEDEHRRKIRDLEADYTKQLAAAKDRITALEAEVDGLYRRLYGREPDPRP